MGVQLREGESVAAFIARRRAELKTMIDSIPTPAPSDATTISTPDSASTPEQPKDERGWFERFAHGAYVRQREQKTEKEAFEKANPDVDHRGTFEKYAHDVYVSRRTKQEEDAALFEADPEAYLKQYSGDATRMSQALGGPATKGMNLIKGIGDATGISNVLRKGVQSRATGAKVAEKTGVIAARTTPQGISKGSLVDDLVELSDEATDLAGVIRGRIKTFEDAQAAGSKVLSKASLAMKTPDEFGRILKEVPEELLDDFYQGLGSKLVQSVRDMPRLTKSAQANLLSPSGRNILKHTLQGMSDAEFDRLMLMVEKGLWQEARDKILKWGVALPLLGYLGLRQILPKD